jgi:transposase, IS5 family
VARPRDDRQKDLLQPALEEIIDLGHPLVGLAGEIDWGFLDRRFARVCAPGPVQPGLPTRLVAGLLILKHMHNLSDEALCARWLENPYYQFFCGELSFCHRLPFDRSSLTHRRQRLGEEHLVALIQESLSAAHKTGALATRRSRTGGGRHDGAAQTCPRESGGRSPIRPTRGCVIVP